MPNDWRQSDEAIRMLIARAIWKYQEADKSFGDIDTVDRSDGMALLVKMTCIDEAECIRKVILESSVLKARMVGQVLGHVGNSQDGGQR
jgi:hypothetical protein